MSSRFVGTVMYLTWYRNSRPVGSTTASAVAWVPSNIYSGDILTAQSPYTELAVADFNGDGHTDVAGIGSLSHTSNWHNLHHYIADPTNLAAVTSPVFTPTGASFYTAMSTAQLADVDGDGDLDVRARQ